MDRLAKFNHRSNSDVVGLNRRQSVTPSGQTIRRNTYSNEKDGREVPAEAPKKSSKTEILSNFLGIKRKESLKTRYFELESRNFTLNMELRQVLNLVSNLRKDYDAAKHGSPISQYKKYRTVIRRTQMFLQVAAKQSSWGDDVALYYSEHSPEESDISFQNALQNGSVINSHAKEKEALRQRQESFDRELCYGLYAC